jgi:hypothetical protein
LRTNPPQNQRTDHSNPREVKPGEVSIECCCQQVTGTEEKRPGKEELEPGQVDICPDGRVHHQKFVPLFNTIFDKRASLLENPVS